MSDFEQRGWFRAARGRGRLTAVLVATFAVFMCGFGTSGALADAPTMEPVVTGTPDDPNTTSARATFTLEVDPAETETVERFQCRMDGSTAWTINCPALTGGATSGTYTTNVLTNGTHRIQFRAANADGPGPETGYTSWMQSVPAPTAPPVITATPESPMTAVGVSTFKQTVDPADTNLASWASSFKCRLDGGEWSTCGATVNYRIGNGDHKFEVRTYGPGGDGPIASHEWTVDVPNYLTDPINVDDIASTRWDGANAGSGLASPQLTADINLSAGDVNGDGRDDLLITDNLGFGGSTQIIFGSGKAFGARDMIGLGPKLGYRIKTPGGGSPIAVNVGDQNGDGLDDTAVYSTYTGFWDKVFVVYGVEDPASLPRCVGGQVDRCIDPTTMTPDQGYVVQYSGQIAGVAGVDFDGEGAPDIAISVEGSAFVLKGGARSGTVDLDAAVGTDAIKFEGPAGTQFGFRVNRVADLNGDGKDEIAILGGLFAGNGIFVMYGRSLDNVAEPVSASPLDAADGVFVATASLTIGTVVNVGDMNGDGRDDVMVGNVNLGAATGGTASVVYMPELPTSEAILIGDDLEEGDGYLFDNGGEPAGLGLMINSIGDITGDGLGEQFVSSNATEFDGVANAGALYLLKGQKPDVDPMRMGLGPQLTPDEGLVIVSGGSDDGGGFGTLTTTLGDIDGDGLDDYATAASGESRNGLNGSGSVYVVPGKSLLPRSVTAGNTVSSDTVATVNGQVGTNGRAVEYRFEYGETDGYGESTPEESLPANGASPVSADLSGLKPNTQYHYRLVVTNELGLVSSGEDRTFTTTKTPDPVVIDPCDADSTKPGCKDYDYCKANPGKCDSGGGGESDARLAFISTTKQIKVKRGKKGTVAVAVVNTGGKAANGVKVCAKAPKKFAKVKKCIKVGSLGSGKTRVVKVKVKIKRKAKKGKKLNLKLTATGNKLGTKKAKVKVRVR